MNLCAAEYFLRNKLLDMNLVDLALYLNCAPEEGAHMCTCLPNSAFSNIMLVP